MVMAMAIVVIMLASPLVLLTSNEKSVEAAGPSHDVNYYDGSSLITADSFEEGTMVDARFDIIPIKTNNVFLGWATADPGPVVYSSYGARTFYLNAETNLYAVWEAPTITSTTTIAFTNANYSAYVAGTVSSINVTGGNNGICYLVLDGVQITSGSISINVSMGTTVVIQAIGVNGITNNDRDTSNIRISSTTKAIFEGRDGSVINAYKTSDLGGDQSIRAAVIGGTNGESPLLIQVESGTIGVNSTSKTTRAAGIGAGYHTGSGTGVTNIVINGGIVNVTVTGSVGIYSAGIGTGGLMENSSNRSANITINGGTVSSTLIGGTVEGAAIGTGSRTAVGIVTINGGKVTTDTSGDVIEGAGIGGGSNNSGMSGASKVSRVSISNAEVLVKMNSKITSADVLGSAAAGIGGGYRQDGTVTISNSTVNVIITALGNTISGAGIGGGGGLGRGVLADYVPGTGIVTIIDSTVDVRMKADGNGNQHRAAAIGGGGRPNFWGSGGDGGDGRVTIIGGTITTHRVNVTNQGSICHDIGPGYNKSFGANSWIKVEGASIKVSSNNGLLPLNSAYVTDLSGTKQVHPNIIKVRDLGSPYTFDQAQTIASIYMSILGGDYETTDVSKFHSNINSSLGDTGTDPCLYIYLPYTNGLQSDISLEYNDEGKVMFYEDIVRTTSSSSKYINMPSRDLYYRVEYNLGAEMTKATDIVHVQSGSTFTQTLGVTSTDYAVPRTIELTMGGIAQAGVYTPSVDYSTGNISVSGVSGKIIVTADADKKLYVSFAGVLTGYVVDKDPQLDFYIEGDELEVTLTYDTPGTLKISAISPVSPISMTADYVDFEFGTTNVVITVIQNALFSLTVNETYLDLVDLNPYYAVGYSASDTVIVTMTPKAGYVITDLIINGAASGTIISPDKTVATVTFKAVGTENITIEPVVGWKVTHTGQVASYQGHVPLVNTGTTTTLTAAPGGSLPPLEAISVTIGGNPYTNFTYDRVTGDVTIPEYINGPVVVNVVTFYTLMLTVGSDGAVSVFGAGSDDGVYPVGGYSISVLSSAASYNVTFTATSDVNYAFAGWTFTGTGTPPAHNMKEIVLDVREFTEVEAAFVINDGSSGYYLDMTVGDNGSVTVTGSDSDDGTYTIPNVYTIYVASDLAIVTFEAIPDTGYAFVGWSSTGTGTIPTPNAYTIEIVLSEFKELESVFAINDGSQGYYLALIVGDNGSVTVSDADSGNGTYVDANKYSIYSALGEDVIFEAAPDTNYAFVGWNLIGTLLFSNAYTVVLSLTDYTEAEAAFVINDGSQGHYLALTVGANGRVEVFDADSGDGTYTEPNIYSIYSALGTDVTFYATPDIGYAFVGWNFVGATSSSNAYTVVLSLTDYTEADAAFVINDGTRGYYLALIVGANGSVTVTGSDRGDGIYAEPNIYSIYSTLGEDVTFEAAPDVNYAFVDWELIIGMTSSSSVAYRVVLSLTEYIEAIATFVINDGTQGYYLALIVGDNGSVTVTGSDWDDGTYTEPNTYSIYSALGADVTFEAAPDANYALVGWNFVGTPLLSSIAYTAVLSLTDYTEAEVVFRINDGSWGHYLALTVGANGSVTVTGSDWHDGIYAEPNIYSIHSALGTDVTFEAAPDVNYAFAGWGLVGVTTYSNAYTVVLGLTSYTKAYAVFEINDGSQGYYLALTVGANGSVTVTGSDWHDGIYADANTYSIHSDLGAEVTFEAAPDVNYAFVGWNLVGATWYSNAYMVVLSLTEYTEADAAFEINDGSQGYYLALTVGDYGSVTVTGSDWDDGAYAVANTYSIYSALGTDVTFEAAPDANYAFVGWNLVGATSYSNAYMVALSLTDYTKAEAVFVINDGSQGYYLALTVGANGSVTVTGSDWDDGAYAVANTYSIYSALGEDVTFEAAPDANYAFNGWYYANRFGMNWYSNAYREVLSLTDYTEAEASFAINDGSQGYYLVLTVGDNGRVTVTGSDWDDGTYTEANIYSIYSALGAEVTFEAAPDMDYAFIGWSFVGATSSSNAYMVALSLTDYTEAEAAFVINDGTQGYYLALTVGDNGSVVVSGADGGNGTYTVANTYSIYSALGTDVTFEAAPDVDYAFVGWNYVDFGGTPEFSNAYRIILDLMTYVEADAVFETNDGSQGYYLALTVGANGSVVVTGSDWDDGTYAVANTYSIFSFDGADVTFEAVPDANYALAGWSYADFWGATWSSNAYWMVLDLSIYIEADAAFGINDGSQGYYLALTVGANGSVTVTGSDWDDGAYAVANTYSIYSALGEDVTFAADPNTNYAFDEWITVGPITEFSTSTIVLDLNLYSRAAASFKADPHIPTIYVITASAEGGASITPEGVQRVVKGSSLTFYFSAASGDIISSVMVGGEYLTQEQIDLGYYTFTDVKANSYIIVTGARATIFLEISVTEGKGHVDYSVNGRSFEPYSSRVALSPNSSISIVAYADDGYEFKEWIIGSDVRTTSLVTIPNVTSSVSATAHFSEVSPPEPDGFDWLPIIIIIIVILIVIGIVAWLLTRKGKS